MQTLVTILVLAPLLAAIIAGLLPAVRASLSGRAHGLEGTRTSSVSTIAPIIATSSTSPAAWKK